MNRTYCLKRLLEHGALSLSEMVEITGWGYRVAWKALERLQHAGIVKTEGKPQKRVYLLT
jgi:predicted transcriptional regulator